MVRRFNPTAPTVTPLARLPRFRAERLESRDTPSTLVPEEVASLPQLPGMGDSYPIDVQPAYAASGKPLLQEPRGRYAVGTNGGGTAQVNVYDARTGGMLGIITPFGRTYTGGVSVATGDVTGDGIEDVVVAAGRGGKPEVKVFDGGTLREIGSFLAYSKTFYGGVTVAVGDVTGDGRADIVTGAGVGGGPHVKSFSGADLFTTAGKQRTTTPAVKHNFFAWDSGFRGGLTVAVADVNADGRNDLVVGQGSNGGGVRAFSGTDSTTILDLKAFGTGYTGGVSVAAGDVTGDGKADLILGATTGPATVKVFSGSSEVASYTAFGGNVGVRVAVQDIDNDGVKEVVAGVASGRPAVKVMAGTTGVARRSFPAMMPHYTGGLSVG